jgi:hypothetical protein
VRLPWVRLRLGNVGTLSQRTPKPKANVPKTRQKLSRPIRENRGASVLPMKSSTNQTHTRFIPKKKSLFFPFPDWPHYLHQPTPTQAISPDAPSFPIPFLLVSPTVRAMAEPILVILLLGPTNSGKTTFARRLTTEKAHDNRYTGKSAAHLFWGFGPIVDSDPTHKPPSHAKNTPSLIRMARPSCSSTHLDSTIPHEQTWPYSRRLPKSWPKSMTGN